MATALATGIKAPAFSLKDQDGNKVKLSDFKGKRVALYFYPEDDTPTCTVQACNLRDNFSSLGEHNIHVIGISPDDAQTHTKFREKFGLPFTLLSDPDHKTINDYGVWGKKNLYGREYMGLHRTTFLIDEKGIIVKIFLKPRNANHAQEIIKAWQQIDGH